MSPESGPGILAIIDAGLAMLGTRRAGKWCRTSSHTCYPFGTRIESL